MRDARRNFDPQSLRLQRLITHAQSFDAEYDSWEDAYETAVRSVKDANESALHDDFWDALFQRQHELVDALREKGVSYEPAAIIGSQMIAAFLRTASK